VDLNLKKVIRIDQHTKPPKVGVSWQVPLASYWLAIALAGIRLHAALAVVRCCTAAVMTAGCSSTALVQQLVQQ
jgi:hypothetical protein